MCCSALSGEVWREAPGTPLLSWPASSPVGGKSTVKDRGRNGASQTVGQEWDSTNTRKGMGQHTGTAQSNTWTGMGHLKHWNMSGASQTPCQEWDSTNTGTGMGQHSQTSGQEWDITNTGRGIRQHKHQDRNGTSHWDITNTRTGGGHHKH